MSEMSKSKEEPERRFKLNQTVMAQWPGGKLWYRGKVVKNSPYYMIEYEDGTKHRTPAQGIESLKDHAKSKPIQKLGKGGRPRSQSKTKSPQRATSRSRSRSAGRGKTTPGRARSRTPSKSPKTPKRESRSSSRVKERDDRSKERDIVKMKPAVKSPLNAKPVENSIATPSASAVNKRTSEMSINTNNKGDLRSRTSIVHERSLTSTSTSRVSARIAALQTARVAGIVTPELSFESGDLLKKEVNKSQTSTVKVTERHFGGAFGALLIALGVPALVFMLNMMCTKKHCTIMKLPVFPKYIGYYVSIEGAGIYLAWVLFQAILYAIPLGRVANGLPLLDGSRLKYRMNGFWNFVVTMAALAGALYYYKPSSALFDRHFIPVMTTSFILAFLISMALYIKARWVPYYALSPQGNTGNILYDFFMGRELNPRIFGSFDLKIFLEMRLGVIGWAAINVLLLYKDIMELGQPSYPLLLCAGLQIFICADALFFEDAMLSTVDITTEALGFMLVMGNLTFVPFFFTINSRYIQLHHPKYHWGFLIGFGFLSLFGYYIYRSSNLMKHKFRKNRFDPSVAGLKTIQTGRPKELLIDGWWGVVRHPNYLGDIFMALSLCLYTGFNYVIPYAYVLYLVTLLVHRAIRDDSFCRRKYGSAWDEYCSRVRYQILPRIF